MKGILNSRFLSLLVLLTLWGVQLPAFSAGNDVNLPTTGSPKVVSFELPVTVTFFGNNQYQAQNIEWLRSQAGFTLVLINLDDHRNLENELAAGLSPADPAKSTAIAQERAKAIPQSRWDTLFSGPIKAKQWKVMRYPAVVFDDGQSVIYGVTDLKVALEYWRAAKGGAK